MTRWLGFVVGLFGIVSTAHADALCATPLIAHEWGVQQFDAQGTAVPPAPASLPARFHRDAPSAVPAASRVSDLPPDTGVRRLPVVHFYAPGNTPMPVPLGLSVGFSRGAASVWFPQVDVLRPADSANSSAAQAIRASLVKARAQLGPTGMPGGPRPRLPDDPTRQLDWQQLTLTRTPAVPPTPVSSPGERWVAAARELQNALWVTRASETERFVFYEAGTHERVAIKLRRGKRWSSGRREYVIENPSAHPVHDVFILQHEGATRLLGLAPTIAAGGSATVTLAASTAEATRTALRGRWLEPTAARGADSADSVPCQMTRDPAIPLEQSSGHRLYAEELDLLLSTWSAMLFDAPGTTVVYREDSAYLDATMPLSLYSDMHHTLELRRLGLALWQNVTLP